jgi:hypothetical protein
LAKGADLEVLGANTVDDLMMLLKDRLVTPRETQEAMQANLANGGMDES